MSVRVRVRVRVKVRVRVRVRVRVIVRARLGPARISERKLTRPKVQYGYEYTKSSRPDISSLRRLGTLLSARNGSPAGACGSASHMPLEFFMGHVLSVGGSSAAAPAALTLAY